MNTEQKTKLEREARFLHIAIPYDKDNDFSEFIDDGQAPEPVKTNKWHRAEEALWRIKDLHLNKAETAWLIEQLQSAQLQSV